MADPTFDDYLKRLFKIESGGNPNAVTGSNRGLGQFGPREERMYGITDANRTDPMVQAAAVAAEHSKNHETLARALGRDPTFADHYLAHQQGLTGAAALLSNPDAPAWKTIRPYYSSDRIAQSAITGNIPNGSPLKGLDVNDISGKGFTSYWRDKFNTGLPGATTASGPGTTIDPTVANVSPEGIGEATPVAASAVASAAPGTTSSANADVIAKAQKALDAEKETAGERQSKGMMALAQQLLSASQAPKANFMQLAPANTGPVRPLPLNLPPQGIGQS
jgi:hypothetical protein